MEKRDKKQINKYNFNMFVLSVLFGLFMVFIILLLLKYDDFIKIRILRFIVYSLTLLIPTVIFSILQGLFSFTELTLSESSYYVIAFIFYSCFFYIFILRCHKKDSFWCLVKLGIGILLFLIASVSLLAIAGGGL